MQEMMNDVHVGYTVKKKVFIAILAGFLFLGGLITAFGLTNTVLAFPVGAMGDFYVVFDELEGEGFTLNPHLDETADGDNGALVRNKIDSVTIKGLHIFKDIKLPNNKWFRINITTAEPTEIQGLIQDARFVDANLSFGEMSIAQKNTSNMSVLEAFKQNWTHQANTVEITDAIIQTNYLFQNSVNLQAAQISVESIDGPIGSIDTGKGQASGGSSSGQATDGSGLGGLLPKTATNWMTYITIGALCILLGGLFVYRKKIRVDKP